MELTISLMGPMGLMDEFGAGNLLWFDPFHGRTYWAQQAREPWHVEMLAPEDLFVFVESAPDTTATIRLEIIGADTDGVEAVWMDRSIDVIVVRGRSGCRAFGQIEDGAFRRSLSRINDLDGTVSLAGDGRWVVWDEESAPTVVENWQGVVAAL